MAAVIHKTESQTRQILDTKTSFLDPLPVPPPWFALTRPPHSSAQTLQPHLLPGIRFCFSESSELQ